MADEGQYGADFAPDWDGTGMLRCRGPGRPPHGLHVAQRRQGLLHARAGKLDYALVSDGVLQVLHRLALQTSDMSAIELKEGIAVSATRGTLPITCHVVVDVALSGAQADDFDEDGVPICRTIARTHSTLNKQTSMGMAWVTDTLKTVTGVDLWDAEELLLGTDPTLQDTDGDGLTDGAELDLFNTDPLNADSDEDGVSDALSPFPPTNSLARVTSTATAQCRSRTCCCC